MSVCGDKSDDEYSVIGDKGEMGFIDYGDDKSVCSYNPSEEGPVVVSVPFPFVQQKPQSVSVDEVAANAITIENTTAESIELWRIHIYASNPEDCFTLSLMEPSKPGFVGLSSLEDRVLQPRKTLTVWLSCKPKEIGMHTCIVHFDVGDDMIERVVFVLAEDNISKALASKKPYQRVRKKSQFVVDSYVNGVRPSRPSNRGFRFRLPNYEIPKDIRKILESKQLPDAILDGLSKKNYVPYFRALLIMEELRLEEDIRAYDMENVTMKSRGRQFLILEVLGLAERRPSLVHGDAVYARFASQCGDDTSVYEGFIHRVEADQVYLKFADEFHRRHHDQNYYNIRFMYSRVNMRRLYHATEAAEGLHADFLFPSESAVKRQIKPTTIVPLSGNLNEEQLNAVKMILGCKGGVPYIINGPPGTGKTMTLVEAVLQLYTTRKFSRILICASSNSAADHVLDKILNQKGIPLQESDIFRLNASSRSFEDMNPKYLPFCFYEDSLFRCPPIKSLLRYRIIITTYMSSSLLHVEGVKRGNFSHIILDEAGQASEPETMVPISNLCQRETVIVLAGDPKQLGPVVFSPDAKLHGLAKSYLERMFECDLYSEGDEGYVTTLQRNYRSHPDILHLPSELFYCGQLIACHEAMESVPWADLLPNKEFPILFSGVQAYDEREGDNPSWFNRTEASMVVKLIKKLTARNVSEDSIGVITPYRQQVAKIRMALDGAGILNIKIGSVEQFQGQEREVIIISTVRSTIKHDEFDRIHYLGFLSNPKRFNVAITRARSLLVIIGNPHIICKDHNWEKLLWRCVDNNSYEGCSLPERRDSNDDDPNEGWSYVPEPETNNWSDAANQETQWGWSDSVEQGPQGGWSDVPEQEIKNGWSNAPDHETQWGWSDAPDHGTQGGWSDGPDQAKEGWSDGANKETQCGSSDPVEQGTQGGWSDGPDEATRDESYDGATKETQCGSSDPVGQGTQGGWSDGPDEATSHKSYDGATKAQCGSSDPVEQGGWSDGPDEAIKDKWYDGATQESRCGQSDPVAQGRQGRRSDSTNKSRKEGWSDGVDQEIQSGWSDSMKQGGRRELSNARGKEINGYDGDKGTRWRSSVPGERGSGLRGRGSAAAAVARERKGGRFNGAVRGRKGEWYPTDRGNKVAEAKAVHAQPSSWGENFPEPVKDEDQWSDGWK
ncbi:hypothetical protein vseg_012163 [Gypsophila vaccaria]